MAWLALLTLAFDPVPWGSNPIPNSVHPWMLQIVLVPIGVLMASRPLISLSRQGVDSHLSSDSLLGETTLHGDFGMRQQSGSVAHRS